MEFGAGGRSSLGRTLENGHGYRSAGRQHPDEVNLVIVAASLADYARAVVSDGSRFCQTFVMTLCK